MLEKKGSSGSAFPGWWSRLNPLILLILASAMVSHADGQTVAQQTVQLRVIEVNEPEGQILSYRHLAGSTEVHMRGTRLAPKAQVKLKIGSRPGFVELDINRGGISGLEPAHRLGKDFLTYVLWAVSVDGKASNLGEITFEGERPVPVNLTTPYQTFWLMVTAEPNYAVVDPSAQVVLYSVKQVSTGENDGAPDQGRSVLLHSLRGVRDGPWRRGRRHSQPASSGPQGSGAGVQVGRAGGRRQEKRQRERRGVHPRSAQAGQDLPGSVRSRLQERPEGSSGRPVCPHVGAER